MRQQEYIAGKTGAYDGTYTQDSDHNRITTTYWPKERIQSRKIRWGRCWLADETRLMHDQRYQYGLEFSRSPTRDHWAGAALRITVRRHQCITNGDGATTLVLPIRYGTPASVR